jgi:hypothetical protein
MKVTEPTPSKTISLVVPLWMDEAYTELAAKSDGKNKSEVYRDALAAYIAPVRTTLPQREQPQQ